MAVDLDGPAVLGDELARHGQPQARSVVTLGGSERLKNLGQQRVGDPHAVVRNRDDERLVSRLQGQNLSPTAICISGCPNGCAHSSVAPLGLLGRLATTNGTPRPLYDLYLDGGLGRNPNLARLAASKLEPTQTLDAVTKLLLTPP